MLRIRLGCSLVASLGILFALSGCGGSSKGAQVSGKVVLPAGLSLEKDDIVEITFRPDDSNAKSATANVSATGKTSEVSFTANTSETTGVLPGKYKIGVRITPYAGMPGSDHRRMRLEEMINQKFDASKTPLTFEVTNSSQTITIDLGKGTVTKN